MDRAAWHRFAEMLDIPRRAADRALDRPAVMLTGAIDLVEQSYLPKSVRPTYRRVLNARALVLRG